MDVADIPSEHCFFDAQYVRSWLEHTTARHPERPEIFDAFVAEISPAAGPELSILELGKAPVDVVVSMQAVHELRHSTRAPMLYRQVVQITRPGGLVLICDLLRLDGDDQRLFMTVDEHLAAMSSGGLEQPALVVSAGNMALFRARLSPDVSA